MQSQSPIDIQAARSLCKSVEFLATQHKLPLQPGQLDAALHRIHARTKSVNELFTELAAEAGLATSIVYRSLKDVLRDANDTHPWLTIRVTKNNDIESLILLKSQGTGALTVIPEHSFIPSKWPRASITKWLEIKQSDEIVEWILVEAAAPLNAMRSEAIDDPIRPNQRLRGLLQSGSRMLWVAVVYSAVIGLLALAVPITVQQLVNTIAFGNLLQPLVILVIGVLTALGLAAALNALRAIVVEFIQRGIFVRVASDVTWRLLRVKVNAFEKYHGPELVNRFFETVTVQKAASMLLIDGLSILMQTLIGGLLLALYHPWLLVFDVLLIISMLIIIFPFGKGAIDTAIYESKAKYSMEAWLEQLAANLNTFKSARGQRFATERSNQLINSWLDYRSQHFSILLKQILGSFVLQAIASSALLGIGGWLVINRQLTLGQLVASEIVVTLMMSAFTKFGKQLEVFYDLCAALDKLGNLVDLPIERSGGNLSLTAERPLTVTINQAQVHHPDRDEQILTIDHFKAAAGEVVGIIDPQFSGKSGLSEAIFGYYTSTGSLKIDGIEINELPLHNLRDQIFLLRDIEFFAGTIEENLHLGKPTITTDEMHAALHQVGLDADIHCLPDGLQTELQPHGWPLNPQQSLRLMLARACLARPKLLILDGFLDRITLNQESIDIEHIIFNQPNDWTVICISQRPETLSKCKHIYQINHGSLTDIAQS